MTIRTARQTLQLTGKLGMSRPLKECLALTKAAVSNIAKKSDMHRSKKEISHESIREASMAQRQPKAFFFLAVHV